MAVFEISVTAEYVPNWSVLDAIREFLQNGQDEAEADPTHPLHVDYSARRKRITLRSDGVVLDRSVLLLGQSGKAPGTARGQFGEGLDLALLVLVRAGCAVRIENGPESWIPDIRYSEAWGRDVLVVETRRLQAMRRHFQIEVEGIDVGDWETIRRRTLFLPGSLPEAEATITLEDGHRVLLERPGDIYVRGLWVGRFPNLAAGYDLARAQLDRDRKIVDPWNLRSTLAAIWTKALALSAGHMDAIWRMIREGKDDVAGIETSIRYAYGDDGEALKKVVREAWTAQHGDAIPVTSTQDAEKADAAGIKAIVVVRDEQAVMEAATGLTLAQAIQARQSEIHRVWGSADFQTVPPEAAVRWTLIQAAAQAIEPDHQPISITEFGTETTLGIFKDGQVHLAAGLLADPTPGRALITLAHEMAHAHGPDLVLAHRTAMEMYMERLVDWIFNTWPEWPRSQSNA